MLVKYALCSIVCTTFHLTCRRRESNPDSIGERPLSLFPPPQIPSLIKKKINTNVLGFCGAQNGSYSAKDIF